MNWTKIDKADLVRLFLFISKISKISKSFVTLREKLLLAVNMKESRIIKSIKFHAIKHLLDGEYWHIDKLFAYAAAIIYPFIDQVKYDNQSGSIKQFVKVLSKFLRT